MDRPAPAGPDPTDARGFTTRTRAFLRTPAARDALAAFLIARLLGSVAAAIGLAGFPVGVIPPAQGYVPRPGGPLYNLTIGLWERFDALWILQVARHGYSPGTLGATMFPLYPLAIRALHVVGLPSLCAALVVSNASFLVGLYLVHRLAALDHGEAAARRAVLLQALYPGSLFCLAPYSEALALALAAGALLAARARRFWLAGLLGAGAAATRSVGVLVAGALAIEWLIQRRATPRPSVRDGLAILLVPLGLASFVLYWQLESGHPFEFLAQSRAWGRAVMAPWDTLATAYAQTLDGVDRYPHAVNLLEGGAAVALAGVAIAGLFVLRPSLSAFLWLGIAPLLVTPVPLRIFCSLLRDSAVLFPASIAVAALVPSEPAQRGLRALFAGLFALCTALFVSSHWMF